VDIFGNIIEQCEAVLFRQASWNYFDVFLAATGMTDIIMRVSLAQTGQFCGICSEALWLVIWFVDIFGTLAHVLPKRLPPLGVCPLYMVWHSRRFTPRP
jgi:hypothetical protein